MVEASQKSGRHGFDSCRVPKCWNSLHCLQPLCHFAWHWAILRGTEHVSALTGVHLYWCALYNCSKKKIIEDVLVNAMFFLVFDCIPTWQNLGCLHCTTKEQMEALFKTDRMSRGWGFKNPHFRPLFFQVFSTIQGKTLARHFCNFTSSEPHKIAQGGRKIQHPTWVEPKSPDSLRFTLTAQPLVRVSLLNFF